jgi:hypothetical protein
MSVKTLTPAFRKIAACGFIHTHSRKEWPFTCDEEEQCGKSLPFAHREKKEARLSVQNGKNKANALSSTVIVAEKYPLSRAALADVLAGDGYLDVIAGLWG